MFILGFAGGFAFVGFGGRIGMASGNVSLEDVLVSECQTAISSGA